MAGPDSPPPPPPSSGRSVARSIAIPRTVFTSTTASAPPTSAATAISATSATDGDSLANSGTSVSARQRSSSARVSPASVPIEMQPDSTLGQDTFSSRAATAGCAPMRRTAAAYSPGDQPPTLTTSGTPSSARRGRWSSQKRSSPGLASPIEFTIPAGVSTIRGGGLPSRGRRVTVLVTKAPSPSVPAASASSVPEPLTSGFASSIPHRVVRRPALGEDTRRLHDRALDAQPLPLAVDPHRTPVAGAEPARHGRLHRELTGHPVLRAQRRDRVQHGVRPAGVHRPGERQPAGQRLGDERRLEHHRGPGVDERRAHRLRLAAEAEHGLRGRAELAPQPRQHCRADAAADEQPRPGGDRQAAAQRPAPGHPAGL